jgi:superkiller protein 3
MRKSAWLGLLAACGVLLGGWLAVRAQRAEQAHALTDRARHLLQPPLREAASLRDIRGREARELLEEAHELSPLSEHEPLIALARAFELYSKERYAAAEQALASQKLDRPDTLQLMAAIKLARGDARAAQALMSRTSDTTDPRAALVRSDIARALGRGDLALASVEGFIQADSPSAALYERRGLAHELLGNLSQASADLARAAELDRKSTSSLLALGRLERQAGRLSRAIVAFHEASQRAPDEAEAWLGAGVCRAALGENVAARMDLERAAGAAPTRTEPLVALADLDVAEHNLAGALRRYRAAVLLDPKSSIARVKLGNTLMRAGEIALAMPEFRAALADRPDLAAAHNGLGAALFAQGDLDGAEAELKSAAELDPKDAHPWLNLARLYKRRGDDRALESALERARERDPANVLADRR